MKPFVLGAWFLVLGLLPSCVVDQYEAGSATGNYVKETYASLGGTASVKRSDGSSLVHDHQASFKDAMQMGGMVLTAWIAKAATEVQELTKQLENKNLTSTQLATIQANRDTLLAQISAGTKQLAITNGLAPKG